MAILTVGFMVAKDGGEAAFDGETQCRLFGGVGEASWCGYFDDDQSWRGGGAL